MTRTFIQGVPMRTLVLIVITVLAACRDSVDTIGHDAWCDSIYHQNVGCPKHGEIEVPPAVLARQEADHLAWCDNIGHRNVGCPDYAD